MTALVAGFTLSFSLILAIGAQNAFVLRQGLRNEHLFVVCALCALSDAVLIALGVQFFQVIATVFPGIEPAMRIGGAVYLCAYGLGRLRAAWSSNDALVPSQADPAPLGATVATVLALTWLNPHVYLDTVILIGSVSAGFAGERVRFAVGAMSASLIFFFALGYGARLLRPLFASPTAWRVLEASIGVVMIAIAAGLVLPLVG